MVESRSHGPGRLAEDLGDLYRLIAEIETKDENGALLRDQPAERPIELVAVADGQQIVDGPRRFDLEDPQVGHSPALASCLLDADIREEAVDPRVEPVRIAEAREVTPGDHQRVLQSVL